MKPRRNARSDVGSFLWELIKLNTRVPLSRANANSLNQIYLIVSIIATFNANDIPRSSRYLNLYARIIRPYSLSPNNTPISHILYGDCCIFSLPSCDAKFECDDFIILQPV